MATKTLKILLKERIAHVGKEGDIVEVSLPQARNYYIPKGLAIEATEKIIEAFEQKKKQYSDKNRKTLENRFALEKQLHNQNIELHLVGKGGKIFGGINEHDILGAIKKQFQVDLERRHILLPGEKHIRTAGNHEIKVHLGEDTFIKMHLLVTLIEK